MIPSTLPIDAGSFRNSLPQSQQTERKSIVDAAARPRQHSKKITKDQATASAFILPLTVPETPSRFEVFDENTLFAASANSNRCAPSRAHLP